MFDYISGDVHLEMMCPRCKRVLVLKKITRSYIEVRAESGEYKIWIGGVVNWFSLWYNVHIQLEPGKDTTDKMNRETFERVMNHIIDSIEQAGYNAYDQIEAYLSSISERLDAKYAQWMAQ